MSSDEQPEDLEIAGVRLDVWLDIACLFKTRSEAQKACRSGKVSVNRQPAQANRRIRVGDAIEIGRPFGRTQHIKVVALAERHLPKADARRMYEDLTPAPSERRSTARRGHSGGLSFVEAC